MAIKVTVGSPASEQATEEPKKPIAKVELKIRKTLDGALLITDHADMDIIIMKKKKKIVAFPKDIMSEVVYGAEDRLFSHLRKKGIIKYDSIKGGNVYGSLEGQIHDSQELDEIKATLIQIAEWIEGERPYFEAARAHDEMMDDYLTDPDQDDSTELGEVPHEEEKGSILQHNLFAPYLYGRYTY